MTRTTNLIAATHLRHLTDTGSSPADIRDLAGLNQSTYRAAWRNRPVPPLVHARVLALSLPASLEIDAEKPNLGTRRRLQALVHQGFPPTFLAAALDWPADQLQTHLRAHSIRHTVHRHAQVRALYDQLWDQEPTNYGVSVDQAEEAQRLAQEQRWPGPLHWDDALIEQPVGHSRLTSTGQLQPPPDMAAVIRAFDGEPIALRAADRTAAIVRAHLQQRLDAVAIGEALGLKPDSVKRTWDRAKKRAVKDNEPWAQLIPYLAEAAADIANSNRQVDLVRTIHYTRPVIRTAA
ncbi:hypothetical protein [Kitasatospora sp. NPDC085464]|uniref:hypothetical protein n=1 Tax=Kitasatospora sp. NPDC085464 TaxID=3364063 RepID=UPI0037C7A9D3